MRAEAIRQHTLHHLDYYLNQFADQVEKNGGTVFFAETEQEAVEYLLRLAEEKQVQRVVKSKSMVSEETHVNQRLEQMGIDVVESDLGEYIIQLAKEAPSHIIAPAIHKNRQQIAQLFSDVSGEELPEDTAALTRFARRRLRQSFLNADMGISGCNFGVAETGSIVLVSNEGNARLTTTLPKIHVVMMGMERLVPRWEDLDVLLTLLPRHATGQKLTSYVTVLSGPRRYGDLDGPEEMHVIIVDNGRSNALGSPYQSVLQCIRCGACLDVCPVYRHIGGHAYGSVYPGPIGAVLTPVLQGLDGWEALPYASSLCGACSEVCPVRIPLHDLLINLRQDEVSQKQSSVLERNVFRLFRLAIQSPKLYRLSLKVAKLLFRKKEQNSRYTKQGPGFLRGWTQFRDFPLPAQQSFREWWEQEGKRENHGR
jgi:L-lactate dehydrogenase complex protein LldF